MVVMMARGCTWGGVSEARVAVDVARGETIGARTAAAVTRGLGRIGGR